MSNKIIETLKYLKKMGAKNGASKKKRTKEEAYAQMERMNRKK